MIDMKKYPNLYYKEFGSHEYLKKALVFASGKPEEETLQECFCRLQRIADNNTALCKLYPDFAPYSFTFNIINASMKSMLHGGIIYHGSHDNGGDGGSPTFSVNVDPSSKPEWRIHT